MCGAPIFLFTDFGSTDIYLGQVKAVLHARSPASPVIDLANDLAPFDIAAAAHLLSALAPRLPADAVTMCVVDPGVGSMRRAVAVCADGRWFVGPDNGLTSVVAARAKDAVHHELSPVDGTLSASFHGRDLFAPHAAALAAGEPLRESMRSRLRLQVELGTGDLQRIIYIDHYGNAISGVRAAAMPSLQTLVVSDRAIARRRVFSDAAHGELFWYENSIGLIEIAANRASAAALLRLSVGSEVRLA